MTRQDKLVSQAVHVPIPVDGKVYRMPFVLFVDWSIQERRDYAEHLREVRKLLAEESHSTICGASARLACDKGTLVQRFFKVHIGLYEALPDYVSTFIESACARRKIRLAWLDNQIGMIDVRLEKLA